MRSSRPLIREDRPRRASARPRPRPGCIWAISASTDSKRASPAHPAGEGDPGRLAVEVAVEVEEVGLDQHRGRARLVEGRSPAHVDRGRAGLAVGAAEVAGVHAVGRQGDVVGHGHVGGREPQLGAAPAVARGPPGRAPRAGRPSRRAASSTSPAASRARIRVEETGSVPSPVRPTPTTSKPYSAPSSRSSSTLPLRPCPKWKSSPTTTSRADSSSTSTSLTKSSAVSFGPLVVEGHHQRAVDAAVGQELELLLEARQLLGRRLGPHDGGGVTVERHHHGREPRGRGPVAQVAQQGAVAEVDPVVGADGDGSSWSGRSGVGASRPEGSRAPVSRRPRRRRDGCGRCPSPRRRPAASPLSSSMAQGPSPAAPSGTRSRASPVRMDAATSASTVTASRSRMASAGRQHRVGPDARRAGASRPRRTNRSASGAGGRGAPRRRAPARGRRPGRGRRCPTSTRPSARYTPGRAGSGSVSKR